MYHSVQSGLFVVALLSVCVCGCSQDTNRVVDAPASVMRDLEGQPFTLWPADQAAATVVVFIRSDCPISNRYAPDVRELCELFQPRGVRFLLAYVDPRETPESIRTHRTEYNYPCQAIHDPRHELARRTGATVTPEAVLFDHQQQVQYRGRINDLYVNLGQARPLATTRDLADAIEAVLAGDPVATPETRAIGCYIADLPAEAEAASAARHEQ